MIRQRLRKPATGVISIMSAKGTTGIGTSMDVKNYKSVLVTIVTASSASCTIKCVAGSQLSTGVTPDFSAAQSVANPWDYQEMISAASQVGSSPVGIIAGNTGIVLTGTDICRNYHINTTDIDWLNFNITAIAAGAVTVNAVAYSNL